MLLIYVKSHEVGPDPIAPPNEPPRIEGLRLVALQAATAIFGPVADWRYALAALGQLAVNGHKGTQAAKWYHRRSRLQEEKFQHDWNQGRH